MHLNGGKFQGFEETSIGLDGMTMVTIQQSIVSDGFNGWKATRAANITEETAMLFEETSNGLDGIATFFNGSPTIGNEPSLHQLGRMVTILISWFQVYVAVSGMNYFKDIVQFLILITK